MPILGVVAGLLPLYIAVAIGFWRARAGQPFDLQFIAQFVYGVGAPALVLSALDRAWLPPGTVVAMIGTMLLSTALCAAFGALALRAVAAQIFPGDHRRASLSNGRKPRRRRQAARRRQGMLAILGHALRDR